MQRRTHGRRVFALPVIAVLLASGLISTSPSASAAPAPLFSVNAGGPAISGSPSWSADTNGSPSANVNAAATGNTTFTTGSSINMTDPSIPAGTPMSVFQSERWDAAGGSEMSWSFPVPAGQYQVKLYFAEIYFTNVGQRSFNVSINGTQVLTNYDTVADVGPLKGVVKTFTTSASGASPTVTVNFGHVVENPAVKGIQIIPIVSGTPNQLGASPTSVPFGSTTTGTTTAPQAVQLTNLGSAGDPSITINSASLSGTNAGDFAATFTAPTPITLAPGASTTLNVTYSPKVTGAESATVTINHTGTNALTIPVSGTGVAPVSGPLFSVNAGGPAISGPPAWSADTTGSPSPNVNAAATGNTTFTTGSSINMTDPSIPAGTPMSVFQSERWDAAGGSEMNWSFPVPAGQYQVRLYFAEIYFSAAGQRTFNVSINGTQVLTNYDTVADVGAFKGVVKTFTTSASGASPTVTVNFGHVVENPAVKGIQIIPVASGSPNQLGVSPSSVTFGSTTTGTTTAPQAVQLTNLGGAGDPSITVNSASVSGINAGDFAATFTAPTPISLAPGASTTLNVTYSPKITGAESATVTIAHSGTNAVSIPASGTGVAPVSGPLFSVNAGGPAISGPPAWSADTTGSPSPNVNAAATGNTTYTTPNSINMTDPSIPAGTPMSVFQSERWDAAGGSEMSWSFPVPAGQYQVKLYLAEIYFTTPGQRSFNVSINGTQVLANYDTVADVGAFKGVVKTFAATATAANPNIIINFGHVVENPSIKGIQILANQVQPNVLGTSTSNVAFGTVAIGQPTNTTLTLTNLGQAGDPTITINGLAVSGTDANQFSANVPRVDATGKVVAGPPIALAPGASTTVTVWFAPATGARSGTLTVTSTASNASLPVSLTGTGTAGGAVGFRSTTLTGTASGANVDVVRFGPDGRLYVAEFSGLIHAYTLTRNGVNSYSVTATETINLIQQIPNHDDNGALNPSVNTRIVTGLLVVGTAANPRLYVTSSDPRIGAGTAGTQTNVDTNSSMLSRLDRNGASWTRTDLVRGLPRSEENHSANGMALDPATNTLYIGQGGNTNMGAPSHNFNYLPEYAYSAAVLSVNLTTIGNTTYDLPTLTDSQLPNLTGPFGGDFGRRQAKIVAGGPVQVYASGFRNPYDVVITRSGRMYTADNGANADWGDIPIGNGPNGTCTNGTSEPGVTDFDSLHLITGAGYYGGHPNPTRGNKANTFNTTNPQSPVITADPQQCNYLKPGTPAHPGIAIFDGSTNGIVEYTASNFGGALNGDLLLANWNGNVFDVKLNPSTGGVVSNQTLFSNVSANPLSLTAQGDTGQFPGVIFVGDNASGNILVFEPNDFGGTSSSCTGVYGNSDEDGDGFTNADEIRNHINPCSAGSVPHDWNGNHISDLVDPDDDSPEAVVRNDTVDPFAIDPQNGKTTAIPFTYTWDNGAQPAQCASTPTPSGCPGGLLNLGFTGVMSDGHTAYSDLYDTGNMTVGGAAGVLTIDKVPAGDALGALNTQQYGFQIGVNTSGVGTFTVHTRIQAPFAGIVPQGNQSFGLTIGTGNQDNYFKLVATANGGSPGIQPVAEVGGVVSAGAVTPVAMPSASASAIDLYLTINPATGTVQPSYRLIDSTGTAAPLVNVTAPRTVPTSWFSDANFGMALGLIATSSGGPTFSATWKGIDTFLGAPTQPPPAPIWSTLASSTTARQEVSEVYSPTTKKFYVAGGLTTLQEAYNPVTNTWATVAPLPAALDHMQSVELNGLIYYIGGLSCWPNCSVGTVYIYNPTTNTFSTGASMPAGRDRGAGGVAVFNGKIYYAGGLHAGTDVAWLDVYDPVANTWASLANMPEVRDHFHAVVVGNRMYAIGGRRSDVSLDATTAVNDYFDFTTSTWVTGGAALPTARAGFAAAAVGTKILIIGGEGGGQVWSTVESYDTTTNTWSTGTSMPTARHGIEGAVCNGGVYVAEGGLAEGGATQTNVLQAYFPGGVATACS